MPILFFITHLILEFINNTLMKEISSIGAKGSFELMSVQLYCSPNEK